MRKLIWTGIILGLIPLYMGAACGGYFGWFGQDTSGVDAKINEELSVSSVSPLESGLWTYYANYNDDTGPGMTSISSYVDHTAPFATFTTDGLGTQHFDTHVGTGVAIAYDKDKDGAIGWSGSGYSNDYTILNGFCPAVGGTGSSSSSNGFSAYCKKGQWETLVATPSFTETKSKASGTKFSNAKYGNFSPFNIAQVLATSTPNSSGGVTTSVSAVSLPNGQSHTLTTPISAAVLGFGSAIAINADQAGLIELANWLAGQWAGQPDGASNVTLSVNGGAASLTFQVASGNTASIVMANYAATH
jgi:hypothetical protein